MERIKRLALEVVIGALLGGAVAAAVVAGLNRQGLTAGPWVLWAVVAAGVAAAVWYGERVHRQTSRG